MRLPVNPSRSEHSEPPSKLVRVTEAARELAVSTRTIWRLIESGDLKSVRIGRSVRIVRASIDAVCERRGTR